MVFEGGQSVFHLYIYNLDGGFLYFSNFSLKDGNNLISRLPSGINIKYLLNKYKKPPIGRRTTLNKDVTKVKLILSIKNNSNFIIRILYFAVDTLRFSIVILPVYLKQK